MCEYVSRLIALFQGYVCLFYRYGIYLIYVPKYLYKDRYGKGVFMKDKLITDLIEHIVLIKWVLMGLAGFVVLMFPCLIWAMRKSGKAAPQSTEKKSFHDIAIGLVDANRLDELIGYGELILKSNPNSFEGNWYLGVGYYYQKVPKKSKEYFEKARQLKPIHYREFIEPYLDELGKKR